ncbi:MAG: DUF3782 domain-containing protein [Nitrososphaerota archaeon]
MIEEFLERLEKDKKLRMAVAGILGFKEILERISKHDMKFDEIINELKAIREEQIIHTKKLMEHDTKFNEVVTELRALREEQAIHTKKLIEHDMKFNEIVTELKAIREEQAIHTKKLMEHDTKFDKINESIKSLEKRVEVTIGSVGKRWGEDLERTTMEIFKEALEKRGIEPGKVSKFKFKDKDGSYTGRRGEIIDVDILIEDEKLYIIEVKSHAELDHVERLIDKVPVVEKVLNRKAEKVYLVAVNINDDAFERAKEEKIEVIYGSIIKGSEEM